MRSHIRHGTQPRRASMPVSRPSFYTASVDLTRSLSRRRTAGICAKRTVESDNRSLQIAVVDKHLDPKRTQPTGHTDNQGLYRSASTRSVKAAIGGRGSDNRDDSLERRTPGFKHARQASGFDVRLHVVLGQIRDAQAVESRLQRKCDLVDDQLPFKPHVERPPGFFEFPRVKAAAGG